MANGFVPNFLRNLKLITNGNAPAQKITPKGFLRYLIEKTVAPDILNEGKLEGGIYRDLDVKYRNRGTKKYVTNEDNCEIDVKPVYKQITVDLTGFSKLSLFLDDETIGRYEEAVTKMMEIPGIMEEGTQVKVSPPKVVIEFWDMVMENLNGLLDDVDENLLTSLATSFGTNVRTGVNTTSTINISKDAQIRDLEDGIPLLLRDFQENELTGRPSIIGSGLIHSYTLANQFRPGNDMAGFSEKQMGGEFDFYYDPATASILGTNQVAVLAPGAVGLIHRNKYLGFRAGFKGADFFYVIKFPIVDSLGNTFQFPIDVQFHYFTCPQEVIGGTYFGTQTIDRGWQIILSKNYDLFSIPTDAFAADDRLTGVNGALRYTLTNICDTCD